MSVAHRSGPVCLPLAQEARLAAIG